MPVQDSPDMATKCKRKWMMLHQKQEKASVAHLDDSLTSLQWLPGFTLDSDSSEGGPQPSTSAGNAGDGALQESGVPNSSKTASTGRRPPQQRKPYFSVVGSLCFDKVDYKNNPVKPPYSYASLIYMAMESYNYAKIPLATIYNWITEHFCYYKDAEPSWQNSVRHNLSLNKCFVKAPRERDDPGKGGLWQIDPMYAHMFVDGVLRRRRQCPPYNLPKRLPRITQKCLKRHLSQMFPQHEKPFPKTSRSKAARSRRRRVEVTCESNPLLGQEPQGSFAGAWDSDIHASDDNEHQRVRAFDDLELNAALHSLGREMDELQPGAGQSGLTAVSPEKPPGFSEVVELSSEGPSDGQGFQQQPMQIQLSVAPCQYYEELAMLSEQQTHPWEGLKEDVLTVPITVENGIGVCEGFFFDLPSWDRMEPYLV